MILVLIIVPLISLNSLFLQQAKAQTIINNTSTDTSTNATIINNTYTNIPYGITMSYPANWTINNTMGTTLLKSVTENASSNENVPALNALHFLAYFYPTAEGIGNVTVTPTVVSLSVRDNVENFSTVEDYVNYVVKQQKADNSSFQLENSSTSLGGNIAEKLVYNSISNDNKNKVTKIMTIITLKDNKIILFVFSSSPVNNERYLPVVENMWKSLTIK